MAVLNPPIAVQALATHNADDLRGALAAGMTGGGLGLATALPRGGILPGWGKELSVAQAGTPAMSVVVGAGKVLAPAPTSGHGGWYVINDADLTVTIAASSPTQPRTDLIIARVADAQYHTGADNAAAIKVITGTAGAGAPVPSVPVADGAYVVLAKVAVAANATTVTNANITENTSATRPYTVAAGGILPVANAAARTALTGYVGMHVIEADTKREYVCTVAPATWVLISNPAEWVDYAAILGLTNITANNYVVSVARCRISAERICHIQVSVGINNTSTGLVELTGLPPVARSGVILGSVLVVSGGSWFASSPTGFGVAGQTACAFAVHGTAKRYFGEAGVATFIAGDGIYADLEYETTAAPN